MISEVKTFDDNEFSNNGYDLLRYLSAGLTVLAHFSWKFGEFSEVSVPLLSRILDATLYFNPIVIFLSISGYLIASSVDKSKDLKEFFSKRILRLYPEYWMSALITFISLVIVVPHLIDRNILFWLGIQIVGISNTPVPLRTYGTGSINGSLWSVMVQIQLYVVLGFLHKYLKRLNIWQWLVVLTISLGANIASGILFNNVSGFTVKMIGKIFVPYLIWFFTGAFIYYKRDLMIPFLKRAVFLLLIAYVFIKVIGIQTPGYFVESLLGVLCSLIFVGGGYLLSKIHFKVDLTYGMFLYHWPVLNVIIHYDLVNKLHWVWCFLILAATTLVLAFLSWKFINQPSKKLFNNLTIRKEKPVA